MTDDRRAAVSRLLYGWAALGAGVSFGAVVGGFFAASPEGVEIAHWGSVAFALLVWLAFGAAAIATPPRGRDS